ncbi:MAG: peptidoglycan-binding domain-containing protein [Blastocatellia bacterium]
MKTLLFSVLILALLSVSAAAQTGTSTNGTTTEKPKPVIFRATKDQIKEVQTKLKTANLYSGEATGKLDDATRSSIRSWQKGNGLKETGTLNRATLEKMGIELTEKQKTIPISENSYASAETNKKPAKVEKTVMKTTAASTEPKPKKTIFRATKDQVMEAQKILKGGGMYVGEQTGKLDDATRAGLKKYQEANSLKVTGTLNQVTLEKMGVELTDKQKADAADSNK